jgi:hypothetical protein
MEASPAIGDAIRFLRGFQDFLCQRSYAVIAIHSGKYVLVEIDARDVRVSKNVRSLPHKNFTELLQCGAIQVAQLPPLPRPVRQTQGDEMADGLGARLSQEAIARRTKLTPFFERRDEILSFARPAEIFNAIARHAGLNQTYTRALFFRWAAYSFDNAALEPWFGKKISAKKPAAPEQKRGPKVADPSITPVGWSYDPAWEPMMLAGWKKYAIAPTTRHSVHSKTLASVFGCIVDTASKPVQIFHPEGKSFPNERQFARFIKRTLGEVTYREGLYGKHTVHNHPTSNPRTIQQYVTNLLQEVHWDAQELAERPGDFLDSSRPGKPIIRVAAICVGCGGDVGLGYDYGSESRWAYLMALLSMCMPKSEFAALFGVEILDENWPAIGVMMKIRGDRGPAIAQPVTEVVSDVLKIWQEWCASYDPLGKAVVEAAHYKQPSPEGPPISRAVYRTPIEIIRDDLRKTEKRFRSADMSHRIESLAQAKRVGAGTPLSIWQDLKRRGLYVGQRFPLEKIIPHTVPRHEVTICSDGVHLGAQRYLSQQLEESHLLERADGCVIKGYAYSLRMVTKHIWLEYNGGLMQLTAVPVRLNAMDAAHSMTLEESFAFEKLLHRSRRESEQLSKALDVRNEIENEIDRKAVAAFQKNIAAAKSVSKNDTVKQHERILKKKR